MKKWKAKLILTGLRVFHQMFQKQYPTYNTQKTKGNDSFSKISKCSKFCFAARIRLVQNSVYTYANVSLKGSATDIS